MTVNKPEKTLTEVFDETAYRKTQQSQESQGDLRQRLGSVDRTLKVSLGKIERGVAVTGIIGGLIEAGRYFYNKEIIEGWIGVAFFLVSGIIGVFLSRGWIEATNEIIIIRTTFHRHEFIWGTLQKVFTNSKTGMIALVGYNNQVVLPGTATWSGNDKELLSELIQSKIAASKIQPVENPKMIFWRSKTF